MKATKRETNVKQIELVETYNLYRSIDRLINAGAHDPNRWKRALIHALGMTQSCYDSTREKIRIALEQP